MKTRFAPSPTGYVHVGSLRTALYCYLFARHNKGTFVLRIEDTDQTRLVEGALKNLIEVMEWAGLEYDEGPRFDKSCGKLKEKGENGPYIQSQRFDIYKDHAGKLLDSGNAYHCFCTKERLDLMREDQEKNHQAPMYDRKCLYLDPKEVQEKLVMKEPHVLRQKIPYETLKFTDIVRGKIQFEGRQVDDQVLMKSDGFPTYHLANVVDDHLMGITHVIRGEEWLPSTPKHIWLYKAFGWDAPEFAHIPLLLDTERKKLSKRHGHVSVEEFINEGADRDALINFVAFLGWHPGGDCENEIFTMKELIEKFTLEKVHKAGAIFDLEKLAWFTWQWRRRRHLEKLAKYARELEPDVEIEFPKKGHPIYHFKSASNQVLLEDRKAVELLSSCRQYLPKEWGEEEHFLRKCINTIEEKVLKEPKTAREFLEFYFTQKPYQPQLLTHEKMNVDLEMANKSLQAAKEDLEKLTDFSETKVKETLFKTVERLQAKNGQILWPLRAALTGEDFSPGAFEVTAALGKKKSIERIEKALALLKQR